MYIHEIFSWQISFIRLFVRSFFHSFICLFLHLFFIPLFVCFFAHSFMHSFKCLYIIFASPHTGVIIKINAPEIQPCSWRKWIHVNPKNEFTLECFYLNLPLFYWFIFCFFTSSDDWWSYRSNEHHKCFMCDTL